MMYVRLDRLKTSTEQGQGIQHESAFQRLYKGLAYSNFMDTKTKEQDLNSNVAALFQRCFATIKFHTDMPETRKGVQ